MSTMKRNIITIQEDKCTGCGLCIPDCPEGALQVIDGKARLVSDLLCDGLGACLGTCPEGALLIEERDAEVYDEKRVLENIVKQGEGVLKAHLEHLRDHGQQQYLDEALDFLKVQNIALPEGFSAKVASQAFTACPGSKVLLMANHQNQAEEVAPEKQPSYLRQWPVQMHLVPPTAPCFQGADILLAADCVAYALGDFHSTYLKGKSLGIACPKLDVHQDIYLEKIRAFIDEAKANSLTVMIMEVPCCRGLLRMVNQALMGTQRKIPVECITVGVQGEILSVESISENKSGSLTVNQ